MHILIRDLCMFDTPFSVDLLGNPSDALKSKNVVDSCLSGLALEHEDLTEQSALKLTPRTVADDTSGNQGVGQKRSCFSGLNLTILVLLSLICKLFVLHSSLNSMLKDQG